MVEFLFESSKTNFTLKSPFNFKRIDVETIILSFNCSAIVKVSLSAGYDGLRSEWAQLIDKIGSS